MKKKITTIEDLAILMQNEFLTIGKKFDKFDDRFDDMGKQIKELRNEIMELRADIDDLKLRMGEMVYRFEFKDFEKRLRRLEAKVGVRS